MVANPWKVLEIRIPNVFPKDNNGDIIGREVHTNTKIYSLSVYTFITGSKTEFMEYCLQTHINLSRTGQQMRKW